MPSYCYCNRCERGFGRKGDLNRHMRIHTGERPYPCNVCGKAFTQGTALKTHMNIHTKEKPYKCGLAGCNSEFGDPSSCSRHRRERHSNIKGYKCKVCSTQIKRRSSFTTHLRKKHPEYNFTEEEITQMAILDDEDEDDVIPAVVRLAMPKREEEPVMLPSVAPAYPCHLTARADRRQQARSHRGRYSRSRERSPCPSSLLASSDRSLGVISSHMTPSLHTVYEYYPVNCPPAPRVHNLYHPVQLQLSAHPYAEPVGMPHGHYTQGTHFDPFVVDGCPSPDSGVSSASSSPLPSPPSSAILGFEKEPYSSVFAATENDCSAVAQVFEFPATTPEWAGYPGGPISHVTDDYRPLLDTRF